MPNLTSAPEETKKLAAVIAGQLQGGEIILLEGGLGAGKTTFVQGLVQGLGSKDRVHSPTFTIMNIYEIQHPAIKQVVHLDFYRVAESRLEDLGLDEWLGRKDTVIVAEWPPENVWPPNQPIIRIRFSLVSDQERKIIIEK